MPARYEVVIETHFCAAHALRDYKGKDEPLHGHNFHVEVTVWGTRVDRAGMLVDFLDLKPVIDAEVGRLNYGSLNDTVPEFAPGRLSPSAENIARVLFKRIAAALPGALGAAGKGVRLKQVKVGESPGCWAVYAE